MSGDEDVVGADHLAAFLHVSTDLRVDAVYISICRVVGVPPGAEVLATVRRDVPDDADRLECDEPLGDELIHRGQKRIHLVL